MTTSTINAHIITMTDAEREAFSALPQDAIWMSKADELLDGSLAVQVRRRAKNGTFGGWTETVVGVITPTEIEPRDRTQDADLTAGDYPYTVRTSAAGQDYIAEITGTPIPVEIYRSSAKKPVVTGSLLIAAKTADVVCSVWADRGGCSAVYVDGKLQFTAAKGAQLKTLRKAIRAYLRTYCLDAAIQLSL